MRTADLIGGVMVLLLGLAICFFSWTDLPYTAEYSPGPGFLPLWLGLLILICGLLLVAKILRQPAGPSEPFFKPRTLVGGRMLGLIVGTFLLLPVLGFSVGLGGFTLASMRLIGKHTWTLCGVTAVVTAIGIHYVFGTWLEIPLLTGIVGW